MNLCGNVFLLFQTLFGPCFRVLFVASVCFTHLVWSCVHSESTLNILRSYVFQLLHLGTEYMQL